MSEQIVAGELCTVINITLRQCVKSRVCYWTTVQFATRNSHGAGGARMAEFVESLGRYVYDAAKGTVATVMRRTDAAGHVTEVVTHITTVQIFLAWAAEMRAVEADILRHQARQNVVELGDFRRVAEGD
jgi:hypothetical protein